MVELEIEKNIGSLLVIDDIQDFQSLIEELKTEGGEIEQKYITALIAENSDCSRVEGFDLIFDNCVFNRVLFEKSYFKNCYFKNCDFSNCDFSNSTFSNCKFQNVKGVGTDFSDSAFKNIWMKECLFRYAVFTSSLLNDCHLEMGDMAEAYFDNCKVKKLTFDNINLMRANFYKTPLKGIDLRTCQIEGIILSTEAKELNGAVVEMLQAAELAKILGVIIK